MVAAAKIHDTGPPKLLIQSQKSPLVEGAGSRAEFRCKRSAPQTVHVEMAGGCPPTDPAAYIVPHFVH
jgi:hypothetical protein